MLDQHVYFPAKTKQNTPPPPRSERNVIVMAQQLSGMSVMRNEAEVRVPDTRCPSHANHYVGHNSWIIISAITTNVVLVVVVVVMIVIIIVVIKTTTLIVTTMMLYYN